MNLLQLILKLFHIRAERKSSVENGPEYTVSNEKLLNSVKNRFNYASSTCSARILSNNPETLSASSVLSANKDAYLRSLCSLKNKFLVVELCEEIRIDSIVLGNYELFSSTFRRFKVYAAIKSLDPSEQILWKLLVTAQMSLEPKFIHSDQAFPIESPPLFFKYLRINFDDDYYGNEELCPLSVLKVFGKNMIDEFVETSPNGNDMVNYHEPNSDELKLIFNQMNEIREKLSEYSDTPSNLTIFLNQCPIEESDFVSLKDSYARLEKQASILRQTSNVNIFKLISDRLNKLETSLKNPLNLILLKSENNIPPNRLISDSTNQVNEINEISIEQVFSTLNENIFNLKSDFTRVQSELSAQQLKVSILIFFNCVLLIVIIYNHFRRKQPIHLQQNALKRLPLSELKSPSLRNSSSRSGDINPTENTPGVVLSDDEVLLLDESK